MEYGSYAHGLKPEQIDDLVENSLRHYERNQWLDISTRLQEYFAMSNMLLGDRMDISGGYECQWQIKVRNSGAARNTGLYAVDDIKVVDYTKVAKVPWTMQTTNFAYDIHEEAFNQGDRIRILNYVKLRTHDALTSLAELMEDNFWGLPQNSTDEHEQLKPLGVPYWITRNSTKGFNGALPIGGGHVSVAGLDPVQYDQWRNWTGSYTQIAKRDLVRQLREAHVKTKFKEPIKHPGELGPRRHVICTTYEVISGLEEILEDQNENLGKDVATYDGEVHFRKTPVKWVPILDELQDATGQSATNHYGKNPIYGIDKNTFKCAVQSGKFMQRHPAKQAPNQHTVRHVHYDTWMQYKCRSRRNNFHLSQKVAA